MNEKKNPINIIIIGLENAGKSTLLYRIAGRGFVPTYTTIGLNAEIIQKEDLTFQAIDIGGQEQLRETLWPHYTTIAKGVIFVFDIFDKQKLKDARLWFNNVLNWISKSAVMVFLANKVDLKSEAKNFLSKETIIKEFRLDKIASYPDISFRIFEISAKTGKNVDESMNWLFHKIRETISKKTTISFVFIYNKSNELVYDNSSISKTKEIKSFIFDRIRNMREIEVKYQKISTQVFTAYITVEKGFSVCIGSINGIEDQDLQTASYSISSLIKNELSPIENYIDKLDTVIHTALINHRNLKRKD